MTAYTWIGAGTIFQWGQSTKWSPLGVPSTADDSASFTGTATYKASLVNGSSYSVGQVTLDDANATFDLYGDLSIGTAAAAGTFTVSAGTMTIDSFSSNSPGQLRYATVADVGGTITFHAAWLVGVTWQGTLDLSAASASVMASSASSPTPANAASVGLRVEGAGGVGNGTVLDTGSGSLLVLLDYETFDHATIDLGNGTSAATLSGGEGSSNATGGAQVTLGPDVLITSTGANRLAQISSGVNDVIINQGTILAGAAAGTLTITALLTNQAAIQVTNGDTLAISGNDVTNSSTGTIAVDRTSSLIVSHTLKEQGGLISVASGGTLSLSYNNTQGVISGYGTIAANITSDGQIEASGGTLSIAGSVLDPIAMHQGTLVVDRNATLMVSGRVTARSMGFDAGGGNATLVLGTTTNTGQVSEFAVSDTLRLTSVDDSSADITAVYHAGTLDVMRGATLIEAFQLYSASKNYGNASFTAAADAGGGTDITTNAPCYAAGPVS